VPDYLRDTSERLSYRSTGTTRRVCRHGLTLQHQGKMNKLWVWILYTPTIVWTAVDMLEIVFLPPLQGQLFFLSLFLQYSLLFVGADIIR